MMALAYSVDTHRHVEFVQQRHRSDCVSYRCGHELDEGMNQLSRTHLLPDLQCSQMNAIIEQVRRGRMKSTSERWIQEESRTLLEKRRGNAMLNEQRSELK